MSDAVNVYARRDPELYVLAMLKRAHRIPLSLDESGVLLGFTKERVRQIQESALTKLRAAWRAARPDLEPPDRPAGRKRRADGSLANVRARVSRRERTGNPKRAGAWPAYVQERGRRARDN